MALPTKEIEAYVVGLLIEEMGEAIQLIGKAMRFGIDTPGPPYAPYGGASARQLLETELGDVSAAIEFAVRHGVVRADAIDRLGQSKLFKLLDASQTDNLGRQLAPQPGDTTWRA